MITQSWILLVALSIPPGHTQPVKWEKNSDGYGSKTLCSKSAHEQKMKIGQFKCVQAR